MLLSLSMYRLFRSCNYNKLIWVLDWMDGFAGGWNNGYVVRSVAVMKIRSLNSINRIRRNARVWLGFSLSLWLALLYGISVVDGSMAMPLERLPSPDEVLVMLKSLGFAFAEVKNPLLIRKYAPEYPEVSSLDWECSPKTSLLMFKLINTPSYIVENLYGTVCFNLPRYRDIKEMENDLAKIRNIAFIRTSCVIIVYDCDSVSFPQQNLRILSRVVNMFDCESMEIRFDGQLQQNMSESKLYFAGALLEAKNTVGHATYKSECKISFLSQTNARLDILMKSGIILLRPFSHIALEGLETQNYVCLNNLKLLDNYTLLIECLPSKTIIDFALIGTISKCRKIELLNCFRSNPTIRGLDIPDLLHKELTLSASFKLLYHLGRNHKNRICVNTITGFDLDSSTIYELSNPPPQVDPQDCYIVAKVINLQISPWLGCDLLAEYQKQYIPSVFTPFGILVDGVNIRYASGRSDLLATLNAFYMIDALPLSVVSAVLADKIVCCGIGLSNPYWTLQAPVKIQLDHSKFDYWINSFYCRAYQSFCQCIQYSNIEISGSNQPLLDGQLKQCTDLLYIFKSIYARVLIITNVRAIEEPRQCIFSMSVLNHEVHRSPQWHLNIESLVLDNVNPDIIYWMLRHYTFDREITICILNQHFKNLAITQLLSPPFVDKIACIQLNDFHRLDEICFFHSQDQISDFSLFEYAQRVWPVSKPGPQLGKLQLFLHNIDYSPQLDAVFALECLGVDLQGYMSWE
ncbi:hypothetical protein NEHOM01_1132 [Nematocida homosporus]|uniref:uncharacterized protein n=1 Tax=Nematocida homosporus TaxID=1912981 RepID=UPI00221F088B|nr:uncharacterized protein NEHOM01_1132 [Nematocida homosporus]KAI5185882.1 hypothetical protein NEHOM01_1132 [Nematocida homosporus]